MESATKKYESLSEDTKKGLKILGITAGIGVLGYVSYKIIQNLSKKDQINNKKRKPTSITTTTAATATTTTETATTAPVASTTISTTSSEEQISLDTSSWKTYEGSKNGIRFKYPPQFTDPRLAKFDFMQANILSIGYGGDDAFINFTIEEKITDALEPFVESSLQLIQYSSPNGMRVISKQNRTVAGRPAVEVEIEIREPQNSQLIRIWFLFFIGDSLIYCLKFQKKRGQEKLFEVLQQLASTIEVLSIPTTGRVDFYGKKYNLQILLPVISMVANETIDPSILLDAISGSQGTGILTGIQIVEPLQSNDVRQSQLQSKTNLQTSSSLDGVNLLLNGMDVTPYSVLQYQDEVEGKICQFTEVLFQWNGQSLIVIGFCEESQFSHFIPQFVTSINSLRLSTTDGEKSYSLYTNGEHGFSITAELGCQIAQFLVGDEVVCLSSLKVSEKEEEVIFAETRVSVNDKPLNVSISNAQELKEHLKAQVEKDGRFRLQVKSAEVIKIRDFEAAQILYTQWDPQNGQLVLFITTSILHANKIYTISSHTYDQMYTKDTELVIATRHQSITFAK